MEASYQLLPLPNSQGNPLVEALHFLCDPQFQEQVVSGHCQWCPPDYWKLSKIYRVAMLEALNQIHVPAPQLEILYEKIVSHLLNSYSHRNPFCADSNRLKYSLAVALKEKKVVAPVTVTTAPTMLVHGLSGAGKTTAIRSILKGIPQVIFHQEYSGKPYQQSQLLWITMDLPATPSIKALALNFFRAIDKALGKDEYYPAWSKRNRDSVDQHITGMQLVAQTHELGLVHIDEMQFMKGYAKSKDTPSMTVLEAIFNKLGIPMLLSTTTAGLQLFRAEYSANGGADFTMTRRMLNDREIQFKPLTKDSSQYKRFIEALFPRDILLNCTALSAEFIDRFHLLSCGLPAIMLRLAKQHHEILVQRAEKKGADCVSTDDVKLLLSVYKNQFSLIDPALSSLRRGLADEYEKQIPQDWKPNHQKKTQKDVDAKTVTPIANTMFPHSDSFDPKVKQSSTLTLGSL